MSLPSGYKELDYILSTGTLCIDTGFARNGNNISFEATLQTVSVASGVNNYIIGAGSFGTAGAGTAFGYYNGTQYSCIEPGISYNPYGTISSSKITVTQSYSGSTITVSGDLSASFTSSNFSTSAAWNTSSFKVADAYASARVNNRIFNVKFYRESTLERNLVPARRESDSEIGMYDTINDVFYTNQGKGTRSFIAGPEVADITEFIELDYILSTGTLYINTELSFNAVTSSYEIDLDFSYQQSMSQHAYFFGCLNSNIPYEFAFFRTYDGNVLWALWGGDTFGSSSDILQNVRYSTKSKATIGGTITLEANGVLKYSGGTAQLTTAQTLTICARNMQTEINCFASMKIYSAKIYKDGVVVQDFIPVKRRTDSVVGLYDTINNKFYTNHGTGEFLCGEKPNVKSTIKYGSTTIVDEFEESTYKVDVKYNGSILHTFVAGDDKILNTKDKICADYILIGSKILDTKDKFLDLFIECIVESAIKVAGDKPTNLNPSVTYTGSEITNGYTCPTGIIMTGNDRGTAVGTYIATYTPAPGYIWSDETTSTVTVTLTIKPSTYTVTIYPDSSWGGNTGAGTAYLGSYVSYNGTAYTGSGTVITVLAGGTITFVGKGATVNKSTYPVYLRQGGTVLGSNTGTSYTVLGSVVVNSNIVVALCNFAGNASVSIPSCDYSVCK